MFIGDVRDGREDGRQKLVLNCMEGGISYRLLEGC